MGKEIQKKKEIPMAEDLIITDEMRDKFQLNEDPEVDEPLRKPIQWRHMFPATVVEQAADEDMQSKIKITRDWSGLRAYYYPDEEEQKAAGILKKSRRTTNRSYYYGYSDDPSFSVSISKWPLDLDMELASSLFSCSCPDGKKAGCAAMRLPFYIIWSSKTVV